MFGLGKKGPVAEYKASGEIERIYHEIKQTLRVSGVNLNFRTWAQYDQFLPLMWNAIQPNLETRAFEDAADQVRAEAAQAAVTIGRLDARSDVSLGESQAFQIRAALDLYHYINPKLLVLTSAIKLSLDGEDIGCGDTEPRARIARGVPAEMYPMEMESEEPKDARLKQLYAEIQDTLSLPAVNSDYRTLALWPDYLAAVWGRLKFLVHNGEHGQQADQLRDTSRSLARQLPYQVPLNLQMVRDSSRSSEDFEAVVETTNRFEQLLPGLILNIALCEQDWRSEETLGQSPFPAPARPHNTRGAA